MRAIMTIDGAVPVPKMRGPFNQGTPKKRRFARPIVDALKPVVGGRAGRLLNHNV